jgi:hypothetical protein
MVDNHYTTNVPPLEIADGTVEELRDAYPGSVRAVIAYDREEYDVVYARSDFPVAYSEDERAEIVDDVLISELSVEYVESLYDDMGGSRARIHVMDGGTVAHFWPEDAPSVIVFLDADADPGTRELTDICGA